MKKIITSLAIFFALSSNAQTTLTVINESDFIFIIDEVIIMNGGYNGVDYITFTEGYVSTGFMQIDPSGSYSTMNTDPDYALSYGYPFYDSTISQNFVSWDKHEPTQIGSPNYPGDHITGPFLSQDLQASLSTMPIQKLHAIKYLIYKDPADIGVNPPLAGQNIVTQPANYLSPFTDQENYKLIFSIDSSNGFLNYFIYIVNLN